MDGGIFAPPITVDETTALIVTGYRDSRRQETVGKSHTIKRGDKADQETVFIGSKEGDNHSSSAKRFLLAKTFRLERGCRRIQGSDLKFCVGTFS